MMKTMKHTYKAWVVLMLTAMVLFPSCEGESVNVTFQPSGPNTLSLKLFCSENEVSRTADNMNNEDAIHRLDIFLYPNSATVDTDAVYSTTISNITAKESHEVNLTLNNDIVTNLFGADKTTCKIYVIANRPLNEKGELPQLTSTKVKDLKAMEIEATFNSFSEGGFYQEQADFVMDSKFTDVVNLDRTTHTLSGEVPLYRAASKISLVITDVKDVPMTDADGKPLYKNSAGELVTEAEGNTAIIWEANTSGMLVRLHDGVKKTHIDNSFEAYTIKEEDYFSFAKGNEVNMTKENNNWVHSPAFYSYSSNWKKENPDEEPYLTLIVPWARSDEKNADGSPYYQRTYYQVPISTIAQTLLRNTHYKINLVVSRLGSFVEEVPEKIAPSSYIIVPWQKETVDADLLDYRYLMVEEKDITIYNENQLYIPYVTSHEAYIVPGSIKFYQQDITGATSKWTEINSNNSEYFSNLDLIETNGVKQIYYKNVLDNVYTSSTFDFTPYKVTFTIQHKDNPDYKEEVTIIQYPAIYGEAERNSDYIGASDNEDNDNHNGYVFVNGYQDTTSPSNGQDFFCSANGIENAYSGASPNMYIFTVTSIQGTDYVVGDPRENNIATDILNDTHNSGTSIWISAPYFENGEVKTPNRRLTNYYGTDASDRTINTIAPKFRVASTYSVLSTSATEARTLEYLKKRCASYQEDGYPAGRWRLPTKAEFEFVFSQVNRNNLPAMYEVGSAYWCAHGLGTPQSDGTVRLDKVTTSSGGHSVRCVYDEWYWTDKLDDTQKNVFTWGDQLR